MKKQFVFITVMLIILYFILAMLCMRFIFYTKNAEGLLLWIITLFMNLFIGMVIVKIKNVKKIIFKSLIISILSNISIFFIIGFIMSLSLKQSLRFDSFFLEIGMIFITGNWILPILFLLVMSTN